MVESISSVIRIAALALLLVVSIVSVRQHRGAADVHLLFYVASLAFVLTVGTFLWARSAGAIDAHWQSLNGLGRLLTWCLDSVFDLNADLGLAVGLVAVVILPQLMASLLSGLFGCASTPRLLEIATPFLVWTLVKFYAVTSGVLLALLAFQHGDLQAKTRFLAGVEFGQWLSPALALFCAFGVLSLYTNISSSLQTMSLVALDSTTLVGRFRRWATRNRK